MGWFDKLKSLFSIEINSPLIYVNVVKNSNNKKTTGEGYNYEKDGGNLKIFLDELSEDKKQEFSKITKDYIEDGNKLLEVETFELLSNLYKYNAEHQNQ